MMGTAQEQVLGNESFGQNQALLRRCTAVDGALKKQIAAEVQTVFLSPLVDQFTGFVQVTALQMIQNLFNSYGAIDKINLEENAVKIMGPYDPVEPLACSIDHL